MLDGNNLVAEQKIHMPTALVVDDSAMDRKLIGGLIEKETNCEVKFAEHGTEALAMIQQAGIDIVLTDLQMPEMDGLNLVQAVHLQFPHLPVVIITGKGSEELATQALEKGAASYVPKSQLADVLPETVANVLAISRADRSYASLIGCMKRNEFSFELTNDPALIDPLVDLVQQMISGIGLCDATERVRAGIAVEQALLNALLHGNLVLTAEQLQQARQRMAEDDEDAFDLVEQRCSISPYRDRHIYVDVEITSESASITIRDEGPGFNTASVPAAGDPSALEREGGRGLVLMRTFMDEVTFNEDGNEVTLVKRATA